ncbi:MULTISPECIES: glycosyltransferase [unclassified Blastococcus]
MALNDARGSYGGPLSVATDQVRQLKAAGHHVALVCGSDGSAPLPADLEGKQFRAWHHRDRFVTLFAPGALRFAWSHVRRFDVVHVHLARDLTTLPFALVALMRRVPVVVQTHGMVSPDRRVVARVLDVLTTRLVLREAAMALALTSGEARDLHALGAAPFRIEMMGNGVPLTSRVAAFRQAGPLILYSSRLAARKRPQEFVRAAALIRAERPDARFRLQGPDEGELNAVLELIDELGLGDCCEYVGARTSSQVRRDLSEVQAFVLPSKQEPYPVAVLEALAAGVPSVITRDTGLSKSLAERRAARVNDGSAKAIARDVLDLIGCQQTWMAAASAGRRFAAQEASIEAIGNQLTATYTRLLSSAR